MQKDLILCAPSLSAPEDFLMQPAGHECHACGLIQGEKAGIQLILGNKRDTCVEHVHHLRNSSRARNSLHKY